MPITVLETASITDESTTLKRTSNGEMILDPQPEDSRNDPLNWSTWRRDMSLLSIGIFSMIGGGMAPILAAGFNDVAATYHVEVPQVALTTGLFMLGLGIGNVIMCPTAILFGKRPVYLFGAFLFIVTSIWCGFSPNYSSLVLARIVQGIAVSPVECLPSSSIAEIFFLHERAYRLGIYTLLLLGGKNINPLISAIIIQSLGWRWVFYIVAIIVAFVAVLLFLFVPESFWDRRPRAAKSKRRHSRFASKDNTKHSITEPNMIDITTPPTQTFSRVRFAGADVEPEEKPTSQHVDLEKDNLQHNLPELLTVPRNPSIGASTLAPETPMHYTKFYRQAPPKSYVHTLKVYSGRLSKDSWLKVAIRPFILYAYPSVLWSAMVYALSVGWLIVMSESATTIYKTRYYHFTSVQTGLLYISPFIGGILGTAVAGKISDVLVRFMSRRNGGIYEPEFRLVMVIPTALASVIGLMGYGWAAEAGDAWIVPTVFFGIVSFGCALGSTTAITFCVDSYRQYAGEALVTLNFAKSMSYHTSILFTLLTSILDICHGLVFSLFFNEWLDAAGSKKVFLALGGIQLALLSLTIPMYIYGKRARMWTVRKNFIESR